MSGQQFKNAGGKGDDTYIAGSPYDKAIEKAREAMMSSG